MRRWRLRLRCGKWNVESISLSHGVMGRALDKVGRRIINHFTFTVRTSICLKPREHTCEDTRYPLPTHIQY